MDYLIKQTDKEVNLQDDNAISATLVSHSFFQRTDALIGKDKRQKLQASSVLIAGLGGVGSYTLEALARAGVGELIIVDDDCYETSNINRQLSALHSSLGRAKTEVCRERMQDINPDVLCHPIKQWLTPHTIPLLLDTYQPNYIADCIDHMTAKIALVVQAQKRGIPIVSALGAAGRLDPARVQLSTLEETTHCPLARVLREKLRKSGASLHYPVVYSDEVVSDKNAVNGTISYLPAIIGLWLAAHIIQQLIKETC